MKTKIKFWTAIFIIPLMGLLLFSNPLKAQNYAINFDGTSGQGITTSPMVPFSTDLTVMAWVDAQQNSGKIFSWGSPQVNNYFVVEVYFGKLRCYVPTPTGISASSTTTLQNQGWKHIAVTKAGNDVKVYVDGVMEASGSFTKVITPTQTSMGAVLLNNILQSSGAGTYDVLSVWNVELDETTIQNYMNTDPVGNEAGIVAFYDFNNPAVIPGGNNAGETTLTDVSGNGYTGTLVDFPLTGSTGNWIDGVSFATAPTVTTTAISSITHMSAMGGGNVTDEGSDPVTARGVCWNTSGNPTISDNLTTDGTGAGSFISNLINLNPSTTYYVRAYATNAVDTSYGSEETFTTLAPTIPLTNWGIYIFIILAIGFGIISIRKSLF